MAKAAAAGETPNETYKSYQQTVAQVYVVKRTKSARESSSWPMRLLFFLHLATFPSMKSKNRPKGINAKAAHKFACAEGGPRQ